MIGTDTVYVVEGEKDVETLRSIGRVATCGTHGAERGKWLPQYTETLKGKFVKIIPENDKVGKDFVAEIVRSLQDILDGTDQPSVAEAAAMSKYLDCGLEHLFSEELTVADITDKDYRTLVLLLEVKLRQLDEAGILGVWDMDRYRRACALPELIRTGSIVPYAELQGSIRYIDWMLRVSQENNPSLGEEKHPRQKKSMSVCYTEISPKFG